MTAERKSAHQPLCLLQEKQIHFLVVKFAACYQLESHYLSEIR